MKYEPQEQFQTDDNKFRYLNIGSTGFYISIISK